ncbi:muscle M-line assembly protein unc-89 isoform X3 [Spodoptera frugiperda]|uniref:Muscle M-line assembly protein unc-89 isoform X3 n=1 Tax=Spodoptera frugiperda TaxID=7108 RepID=A0A9R0DPP9_SPOFR|nr:muscle M-line assembly protein unc-89 isoform X3 [Spodoptera frugiperda]
MPNEEVLGPRKTMFVLVIVVGCFAVLWPRILSPLITGPSGEQLKPNKFDREAGCCEVLFENEMAVLELINEVCSSAVQVRGTLSPHAAAECRKAVNETCGVDLAAFLKRNENVGKTSKALIETMKNSNSSCLKEHFGVPVWSLGVHVSQNSWTLQDTIKQERPLIRGAGPHPALRERGRAIPPGVPSSPTKSSVAMPPHVRVRSSPLSVYYDLDIKPPPIPGMRPPLGSPGGPVPTPKSSMGFVMPIYTICIIVFFVYTISKILFRRTASSSPYETLPPDPQFRRRVFRDDSRSTPDKLGDVELEALRARLAETERAMQRIVSQLAQRDADAQDNNARPYTNGTILHNSGPVHIVASEYKEPTKESLEKKEPSPAPEEPKSVPEQTQEEKEPSPEPETQKPVEKEPSPEPDTQKPVEKEPSPEPETQKPVEKEPSPEPETQKPVEEQQQAEKPEEPAKEESLPQKESTPEKDTQVKEPTPEPKEPTPEVEDQKEEEKEIKEVSPEKVAEETNDTDKLIKLADDVKVERNGDVRHTEEFIKEEAKASEAQKEKQSTPELLEEAIKDDDEQENASVKVVGMEVRAHPADGGAWRAKRPTETPPPIPAAAPAPQRAHEAEQVQSIYLDTEIPQQSRVLVADFAEKRTDRPAPTKHSPMVVSGKMTLSLIQDAPRDTPERDQESTVDDFTTASAVTQNAEKEGESEEEIEEEIEIEEIEEEVEEEEEEEEAVEVDQKDKKTE